MLRLAPVHLEGACNSDLSRRELPQHFFVSRLAFPVETRNTDPELQTSTWSLERSRAVRVLPFISWGFVKREGTRPLGYGFGCKI